MMPDMRKTDCLQYSIFHKSIFSPREVHFSYSSCLFFQGAQGIPGIMGGPGKLGPTVRFFLFYLVRIIDI